MGSDVRTPGVSAQPGCMACTTTPEPARRCAHSRVSTTSARFVRAYATVPSNVPRSICRSSTCRRCVYIPPDVTLTIRDGALLRSRPSSSFVNRNGAATLVANVSSSPSAVTVRCAGSTPALLTSTSSRGSRARNSAEPAHVAEVAEVAPHDFDVAVAGALDNLRARLLAALGAAGQQPDARTEARESRGRGQTEARGRAGHDRDATVHRLELGVVPGVPAQPIAEVRVGREHGGVEASVEHVVQRVAQSDHGYTGWSVPAKTCQASADFASRLNSM